MDKEENSKNIVQNILNLCLDDIQEYINYCGKYDETISNRVMRVMGRLESLKIIIDCTCAYEEGEQNG